MRGIELRFLTSAFLVLMLAPGLARADNNQITIGPAPQWVTPSELMLLVCADDGVRLPSDAAGLTTLRYRSSSEDELKRTVRNACIDAKEHIGKIGVFTDRRAR